MNGQGPIIRYGCGAQECGMGVTEDGPYIRYADHETLIENERRRRLQITQEGDRLRAALRRTVHHVTCCYFKAEHWCSYRSLCYLLDDSDRHYLGLIEAVMDAVGYDPMGTIPEDKRREVALAAAEYLLEEIGFGPGPRPDLWSL